MTDTTTIAPFTISDAIELYDVLGALFRKDYVRWMGTDGVVREGRIRRLARADGASLTSADDVRGAHLHVTSGFTELTIPVAYAMGLIRQGGIAFEARS